MSDQKNKSSWLDSWLTVGDRLAIEKYVETFEDRTSAEIVPMVVLHSCSYGHIPILLFSLSLSVYFLMGFYEQSLLYFHNLWLVALLGLLFSLMITIMLMRFHWVKRVFTPQQDRNLQVRMRAENEFFRSCLNKTNNQSAILLFVSVVEHQAVAIGDAAVNKLMTSENWEQVVNLLVEGIKKRDMKSGFERSIQFCGDLLENSKNPKNDPNEISNKVRFKP